jgi:DnaK suppressor protein
MSEPDAERYQPLVAEEYMCDRQLAYFKRKLIAWRNEILRVSGVTLQELKEEDTRLADSSDWASAEVQRHYHLRTRDRERKLLVKIQQALERIEDGSYGFCEETGEPIGLERLDARPIATMCIEAQERHERREKEYRDA